MYKIFQTKTIYIAKDLTLHNSKKGIEVLGSRKFVYKPWFMGNCDVASCNTTISSCNMIPSTTFETFVKDTLRRPGDRPLGRKKINQGEWIGNKYPCFCCTDTGGMGVYGHPNEAHGMWIPCPFCEGTGGTSREQLEYCYQETLKILQKQQDDEDAYQDKAKSILDKLTKEEQDFIENYFSEDCY